MANGPTSSGALYLRADWVTNHVGRAAFGDWEFQRVPSQYGDAFRLVLSDLSIDRTIEISEFTQPQTTAAFTYGSAASVQFVNRSMHVRLADTVSDSTDGRLKLDLDDGNHAGQDVLVNRAWLATYGIRAPTFVMEGGAVAPYVIEQHHFLVHVPHFSELTILNGITLSVDSDPTTVHPGEPIPVEWHTENGTSRTHNDVHWGTTPVLLTNIVSGSSFSVPNDNLEDMFWHENSTRALLPAPTSPGTIYYEVHTIIDLTSIKSPVGAVSVVERINAPAPATLAAPIDGATSVPYNVSLSWAGSDPDGDAIDFQVYLGPENPPPQASNVTGEATWSATDLARGTTYYWRILTVDATGLESWSETRSFTTTPLPNFPPYAGFNYTVDEENLTIVVNGTGSYDSNGDSLVYDWDFGDGNTGTGVLESHTYSSAGAYNVTLTVTEDLPGLGEYATSHECISLGPICFVTSQADGNRPGDAPGDETCSTYKTLLGGAGGTPGSYAGNVLSNLVDPPTANPDRFDCFKFTVDTDYNGGQTRLYVDTDANEAVTFRICNASGSCPATSAMEWEGDIGFEGFNRNPGIHFLQASIGALELEAQEYTFRLATSRDYDHDTYKTVRLTDYQELYIEGTKFHLPDSDGDGMQDSYEIFHAFGPNDASDGAMNRDADPLTNANEYYFDACSAHPDRIDIFLEIDEATGNHADSGIPADNHRRPDLTSLINIFNNRMSEENALGLEARMHVGGSSNDKCGGSGDISPHDETMTESTWETAISANARADHISRGWNHVIVGHDLDPGIGIAQFPGYAVMLPDAEMDDASWTTRERLKTWCQELAHNFGVNHPLDNDRVNTANNPTDVTCMYNGRMDKLDMATHSQAQGHRQSEMNAVGGNEWRYLTDHME